MLTLERLKEVLHYEPTTGVWTRLVRTGRRCHVGDVAGGVNGKGYAQVSIDGHHYYSHILAWFYMTGEWPSRDIDHRDTDPLNNKWDNLRLTTESQNMANSCISKRNKTGYKGVCYFKRGNNYTARIMVKGKAVFLGYSDTAEEAHDLYIEAAKKYFGDFARA